MVKPFFCTKAFNTEIAFWKSSKLQILNNCILICHLTTAKLKKSRDELDHKWCFSWNDNTNVVLFHFKGQSNFIQCHVIAIIQRQMCNNRIWKYVRMEILTINNALHLQNYVILRGFGKHSICCSFTVLTGSKHEEVWCIALLK